MVNQIGCRMSVKAYSYIRFSSRAQRGNDSIRRQLERSKEWAADQGLELDTSHQDLAVSAFKGEHRVKGALAKFLSMVESGQIARGSYLLVESLDRLSRETETQAINTLTGIALAGIKVVTLADGATYDDQATAMDWMRALIVASRAREESVQKGQRVGAAWKRKKNEARTTGKPITKGVPGWLEVRDGIITTKPGAEKIIKRIFDDLELGLGAPTIARRLNEEGVKPFGRAKGWHASKIFVLTRTKEVCGEYQPRHWSSDSRVGEPDGDPIPGYYPVIISEAQWFRVQEAMSKRRHTGAGRKGKSFANLLTGMARCYQCGGRMFHHRSMPGPKSKGSTAMRCTNSIRSLCTMKKGFNYPPLEAAILRHVPDFEIAGLEPVNPHEQQLALALAKKAEIAAKRQRLLDLLEEDDEPGLRDRYNERTSELKELEAQIIGLKYLVGQNQTRRSPKDHKEALATLLHHMETAEGDDLYNVRANINASLKAIIDFIDFDPNGDVRVVVLGGVRAYRFRDGQFVDAVDLVPHIGTEGGPPIENFTFRDPEREAQLRRIG